jgi:hypothetical protein
VLSAKCNARSKQILGSAGALPSRKVIYQSLIAIRYSPPFRLGRSLALTIHFVHDPFQVSANFHRSVTFSSLNSQANGPKSKTTLAFNSFGTSFGARHTSEQVNPQP